MFPYHVSCKIHFLHFTKSFVALNESEDRTQKALAKALHWNCILLFLWAWSKNKFL